MELKALQIDLPEDILKAKWCGDFERAQRLISQRLLNPKTPRCLIPRLELEREILLRLPLDYPYTETEALAVARQDIPGFSEEEFHDLQDSGAIDWIYVNGKPAFSRQFWETLCKVHPDIALRAHPETEDSAAEQTLLDDSIRLVKQQGHLDYHIQLRASLRLAESAFRPGEKLRVHLPVPTAAVNMRNVRILSTLPEKHLLSPEDAPQRTVYLEDTPSENRPYQVEYEYDSHIDYVNPCESAVTSQHPEFDIDELPPHIRFTPFIRALCKELTAGETNPLLKARRFYDYCTTVVTYSYMREYFTITQIPDYAGLNQKGDCGVQALLFITLCRCAGIPARWQSGLFVSPYYQGCHDWAQFYVEPYGWMFADPSFGGSAYRAGNTERHNYYFGNLDCFRMAANSSFQAELSPSKQHLRIDPYDNQRGEAEYADRGLLWNEVEASWELLEIERLS